MTKIVAFAGKKQSGKNTSCNFVFMMKMLESGMCHSARIGDDGFIYVSDIFDTKSPDGEYIKIAPDTVDIASVEKAANTCIYAFADALKDIAINILGMPREKIYGTDADKAELSNIKWEDMSGVITNEKIWKAIEAVHNKHQESNFLYYHPPGRMTYREVLQYMGTEVFRRMYHHVWIDALIRRIKEDGYGTALICDARFDNEITVLKDNGAVVIGLTKNSDIQSAHASEQVDLSLCSNVIDNKDMTISDQNEQIYHYLKDLNIINLEVS